ncbi:hypothetical protein KI387_006920, partial [Taxus chinensis]
CCKGVEVHAEDVEPEQFVLPHLGKHRREAPSTSDEISLHGERRSIGAHLNPPGDQPL